MALATDLRRSVTDTTPLLALVGATDLAVEYVRDAGDRITSIDPAKLGSGVAHSVQQAPANAVAAALEAAGRAEARYEALAERGKTLVERIRSQKATQELIEQGKATLSRTKAAVTTATKGYEGTLSAARGAATTATNQIRGTVVETADVAEERAAEARKATRTATKRATTTARKRTAATKSSAKGATTSARKTATKAAKAAEAAAAKVGD